MLPFFLQIKLMLFLTPALIFKTRIYSFWNNSVLKPVCISFICCLLRYLARMLLGENYKKIFWLLLHLTFCNLMKSVSVSILIYFYSLLEL